MEPIYVQNFTVEDHSVDRYGRMKPSSILYIAQEMGGRHSALMQLDYDTLARRRLFWAVTRHRVQITRMPLAGQTIRVETWPLPTTRAAFPRSVIAYDAQGNELPAPGGLIPKPLGTQSERTVAFTDLDRNGHMNNTKCMDWIADLLPSQFHQSHSLTDFTVCYLAEAREGQQLRLNWDLSDGCTLQVDAATGTGEESHRVFSAKLFFEDIPQN